MMTMTLLWHLMALVLLWVVMSYVMAPLCRVAMPWMMRRWRMLLLSLKHSWRMMARCMILKRKC
jgi:hypothetical protein